MKTAKKITSLAALAAAGLMLAAPPAWGDHDLGTSGDMQANPDGTFTIDTSDGAAQGAITRSLPTGTTVADLDSYLRFDHHMETGDCGGGAPRIIVRFAEPVGGSTHLVTDGSGSAGWASCPDAHYDWATWDNATASGTPWRAHPGSGYRSWAQVVAEFGDRVVVSAAVVDDSFWHAGASGVHHYRNVVLGRPASLTKQDCKNGGWIHLEYRNQGQCVSDFARR